MKESYSIQEVARILGINTNKIRFYEKKGLIAPSRGAENDYRYFTQEDMIRLQAIILYRALGLSVKEISGLFQNTQKENYLEHFYNQWRAVNNEIHRLGQMRQALEGIMDHMYLATDDTYSDVVLGEIEHHVARTNLKDSWQDKWDFNNWAKDYDQDVKADQGSLKMYKNYDLLLGTVASKVKERLTQEAKVLDIGVGTGELANRLYTQGYDVVGVDQSRAMLEVAKSKNPWLKVRLGEFLKLPFDNKYFEAIVSTYAFHHLNAQEKEVAIDEMLRVLGESGIIVIGDLMYENEEAKGRLYETLSEVQIAEIEDEYYTNIDQLGDYVRKCGKKLYRQKIDEICWVIVIQ